MTILSTELENTLWAAADKLRGNLDAGEYKHVVLGLIFLKYISDAFEEHYSTLLDTPNANPEDRDEYTGENLFYVSPLARWSFIQGNAKHPDIGQTIDKAMEAIEKDNPSFKGMLPTIYGRPDLDKRRLGELVDLISGITVGTKRARDGDVLGRIYEYFLGEFARNEGKKGGQFYTAKAVVKLLVGMLEPYQGRIYDGCCGSGGMFVQSEKFIKAHGGNIEGISVYGQESNPTTRNLARMNLAIHRIDANLGDRAADSFHADLHRTLKADFVMANPPFNMSDWGGHLLREDPRWKYGIPPIGNANFAWVQHMLWHLNDRGQAGIVLSNGSMSSNTGGEGSIRQNLIEGNVVSCMVALPPQLFYTTQIPVCLWFFDKHKPHHRYGETLFIDARQMGVMVNRTQRDLTEKEILKIADTYHAWRKEGILEGWSSDEYENIAGFCYSANTEEIRGHGHVLTPGRYVGAAEVAEDGELFMEKMERLTKELFDQFEEARGLENRIRDNLRGLGYE